MTMQVALLRGVNVGGNRRLPMAELRAAMTAGGFADVRSHIASGNLLFAATDPDAAAEARLEAIIAARFGFGCKAIVRHGTALATLRAANPLPQAAAERPKILHVLLGKRALAPGAAAALAERARDGEIVRAAGGALWIDYAGGIANSRLTPKLLDRLAGTTVTGRAWNTLTKLVELAAG